MGKTGRPMSSRDGGINRPVSPGARWAFAFSGHKHFIIPVQRTSAFIPHLLGHLAAAANQEVASIEDDERVFPSSCPHQAEQRWCPTGAAHANDTRLSADQREQHRLPFLLNWEAKGENLAPAPFLPLFLL